MPSYILLASPVLTIERGCCFDGYLVAGWSRTGVIAVDVSDPSRALELATDLAAQLIKAE